MNSNFHLGFHKVQAVSLVDLDNLFQGEIMPLQFYECLCLMYAGSYPNAFASYLILSSPDNYSSNNVPMVFFALESSLLCSCWSQSIYSSTNSCFTTMSVFQVHQLLPVVQKLFPCSGLLGKSPNMSSVGYYWTSRYRLSMQSMIK
jgi:hypothetical protein